MNKILLVEDNEMNREMLGRRLAKRGFDIVFAATGLEAIEKAQSELPDLILMDLSLPDVDGWEATRRIKTLEATAKIPVIALTAHAMAGDRERAIEAGADDYDTKPIEFTRLLLKIASFLGSART